VIGGGLPSPPSAMNWPPPRPASALEADQLPDFALAGAAPFRKQVRHRQAAQQKSRLDCILIDEFAWKAYRAAVLEVYGESRPVCPGLRARSRPTDGRPPWMDRAPRDGLEAGNPQAQEGLGWLGLPRARNGRLD